MEAWMDGKKVASASGSTVYTAKTNLPVGTHKLTIFASNGAGTKISKVVYFTTKEITP